MNTIREQSLRLDEQIKADEVRVAARKAAKTHVSETHYAGRFGSHYCETHKGHAAGSVTGPRKMSEAAVAKAVYGWRGTVREGILCDECAEPLTAHLMPKGVL